jgi:hypothetical protein
MFCAAGLFFGGTKGVGSRLHLLRSRTHFRGTEGVGSLFHFSAVTRVSAPVFMFCAPGHVFGDNKGVGSRFHVLRSWTHFRQFRRRRVPYSCFAIPDSFLTVPRASALVFMFCAPGFIFGSTEGVGYRFHVLHARTHFRSYRRHQIPFSAMKRVLGPVLMFCAAGLVFGGIEGGPVFMFCAHRTIFDGTEGVVSRFHDLRSWNNFGRHRGPQFPFSCFALPGPFSTVTRKQGPVFIFCAHVAVFGGTGSRFHVLHSRAHFRRYRGRLVPLLIFVL